MVKIKDKEVLRLFLLHCEHLNAHSLIQNRMLSKIVPQTKFDLVKGIITTSRQHVDDEALESLLVRLRKFNNRRDELYLCKILEVLCEYETDPEAAFLLNDNGERFHSQGKYKMLGYQYQGEEFTEADLFDLYINGRIFHADSEKHKKLEVIKCKLSFDYTMFLSAVINKVNAVLLTYEHVIEKNLLSENFDGGTHA